MHNHIKHWTPELRALSRHWWALQADVLMLEFLQTLNFDVDRAAVILLNKQELNIIATRFWNHYNSYCSPQDVVTLDDSGTPPPPPPPPEDIPPHP